MLKTLCKETPSFEFSRAIQTMFGLEGVNPAFLGKQGFTLAGIQMISRLILGKIQGSKLRDRYAAVRSSLCVVQGGAAP